MIGVRLKRSWRHDTRMFALLLVVLWGCPAEERGSSSPGTAEPVVHRDLEGLRRLVEMPVTPQLVWWTYQARGRAGGIGPTDYLLIALLEFNEGDLDALQSRVPQEAGHSGFPTTGELAGLPAWVSGAAHGDGRSAEPFAKSPLLHGSMWVVDGKAVLLSLYTM